jgi:hypothetical protein
VVSSVDERSAVGRKPDASRPQAGAAQARSESESRRDPETCSTRKGTQHDASRAPDGDVDRRGSPGGVSCPRRNANRAMAPAREKVSGSMVVPVRRISGCRIRVFFSFVVCSARSRKAIRRDSKWWTTPPSSQDAEGELLRANRDDGAEEGIPDRVQAVAFTGGGGSDLDPSVIAQAVLRRRKRDPAGDGMSEVMSCTERDHERQRHRVQPERGSRG